jgi:hypothetical protein
MAEIKPVLVTFDYVNSQRHADAEKAFTEALALLPD